MELKRILRAIKNDKTRVEIIKENKSYYKNRNNIKEKGVVSYKEQGKDPLRNADNRISHNFHEILVDEKASYLFTYPVLFDIDNNKNLNKEVSNILGGNFAKKAQYLCVEASNCGTAWLHYWIDENNGFEFEKVETEEIIPIYSSDLKRELLGIIRYYNKTEQVVDEDKVYTYIEYWDKKELTTYKFEGNHLNENPINTKTVVHKLKVVPFIEFSNNSKRQSDLVKYKDLIDLYDKVMSGFANDLEDIQQIIYILENYGGANLDEFLGDLKRYKAIKTNSGIQGTSGGVKTLQIEIPVEARKVILDILKKQIYESGQGLQQDIESFGNASGVALKFFYRKLELKSGLMETEFREGFELLIRAILNYLNMKGDIIQQTYTRNMISNDLENAQIAQASVGVIPEKYILRNHPWIDDPEEAEEEMKKEENEVDPYSDLNNKDKDNNE
ncbi:MULTISPECIES: phage portal protein [Clostridium]|uniref:phage portal protein n=1 Tax=Clostridium TaxID=1485 RepID=UPI000C077696|nr:MULTISPECIES: phage portal protein [Clostridium]MDU4727980.1 phage portal protein [Clostridium sp.]